VLIGSTPETEWDETEQAYMLALGLYRAGLCPNCNGRLEETTAAENEAATGLSCRCNATGARRSPCSTTSTRTSPTRTRSCTW
jgi:hypothetical protein